MTAGIIRTVAIYVIRGFQLLLFIRALLSWFPDVKLRWLRELLNFFTEPIVAPVRSAFDKNDAIQNLPVDLSVVAVFIALELFYYLFALVR